MRNTWQWSVFFVAFSMLKVWLQIPATGEVGNQEFQGPESMASSSSDDEFSAIQTHKLELRLNPGNGSLSQLHVNTSHGKSAVVANSSAFASKLMDDRPLEEQVQYDRPLTIGEHVAQYLGAIPDPGVIINPGSPAPPLLALASKFVTIVVFVLLAIVVVTGIFGYNALFPKPTPMPAAERETYSKSLKDDWLLYFFMMSGCACQGFLTDSYLPSFARMAVDLNTTPDMMSLSLQVNWMVKGLAGLFIGFYTDHVGRKSLMVVTCVLEVIGSLTCGLATDINWFLAGRVFQGISEGGEVLGMIITRDVIDDMQERQKWMVGFMAISIWIPVLAPTAGGMLAAAAGWRTPFAILAAWAAVNGTAMCWILRETMHEKINPTFWKELVKVASNIHLTTLLFVLGIMGMLIASVDSSLSIILTYTYGQSQVNTSLMLGGLVFGYILGLVITMSFLDSRPIIWQLQLSMGILVIPILSSFLIAAFFTDHMWIVYINLSLAGAFILVTSMCADNLFMQPIKEMSGAGAGLKMCVGMTITSVGSYVSRILVRVAGDEPRGLSNWQGFCLLLSFVLYWIFFGCRPPRWADGDGERDAGDNVDESMSKSSMPDTKQPDGTKVQSMFRMQTDGA